MQPVTMGNRIQYLREPGFVYCAESSVGGSAETVTRCWTIRATRCQTAVERALPDTRAELYINLGPVGRHLVAPDASMRATAPRAAWIVGPHPDPLFVAKETAHCDIIGVRLQPGVIPHVLGVPAAKLTGQLIDLDLLWGRQAVERVRTQLSAECDPLKRLLLLREEVERRAAGASVEAGEIHRLCSALVEVPNASVRSVANRFQLSHRRVIEIFDAYIGLKPKAFQRVSRLRRTLERLAADRCLSWARIAHEAGYCDQAHFANEFRRLTGLTLSAYSKSRSPVDEGSVRHLLAVG